ncbi:unnamed protein product [Chondrus crispus]|uniref:ADF-H domain-containing protein n=1 Tax=Chondrus crispus TaxID=2769 RepID=R7QST3_CHOCR|nr:unnamed protein product [Chondrus crispus]CDF40440.1 unnamed protein product [Chondrus crispus]|eukprot:XP_005710734.1 unnamed protein product [Chondrus crispus]
MASGIAIADKCVEAYKALSKREYGSIILKINDDMSEVGVDKCMPPSAGDLETEWKNLVSGLPENGCRYIISDFSWKETPTVTKSKIIMILWSAEYAPVRHRTVYAASKESVATKMAVQKSIQAVELEDIAYLAIKRDVTK